MGQSHLSHMGYMGWDGQWDLGPHCGTHGMSPHTCKTVQPVPNGHGILMANLHTSAQYSSDTVMTPAIVCICKPLWRTNEPLVYDYSTCDKND